MKMNRIDKQQVNDLIHCKVSLFKNDLIEQLRRLIENDELDNLELNLNQFSTSQRSLDRSRLTINKRKFSSSEDDEQDKDSNSNSLESNDKSDQSHETLNLNKILNKWKSTDDEERKDDNVLECNEKLIDKDVLSIVNHHFNNLSNSLSNNLTKNLTDHQLSSPTLSSSKLFKKHSNLNSESIEKSFNETISCLNGVSVQLIGNIRLQLSTSQNSTSSSASSTNDKLLTTSSGESTLLDSKLNNNQNLNNSLLMITECLAPTSKHLEQQLKQKTTTSSSSSPISTLTDSIDQPMSNELDTLTTIANLKKDKNQNFNIDKLIRDECVKANRTFGLFELTKNSNKESNDKELINQQLSTSNDSSSSTLSAVSIDLSQSNSQQQITNQSKQQQNQSNFESSCSNSIIRRRSSGSTTASACSDQDCLSPPNRKLLKTENITPLTSNQSLNLITSINNSSFNLEALSYLSPTSLPQQQQKLNDVVSPTDSLFKNKKPHLKLDRSTNSQHSTKSINDDKLCSPQNFHKKFNPITSPKNATSSSNSTSNKPYNNQINHLCHTNQIKKPEINSIGNNNENNNENNYVMNSKMKKILKSYQELASNSLNGPEQYENLAMLANFNQQYGLRTLDPITAKIASAASAFLNGSGPVPDAQLLMNELTKLQLNRSEDSKSEITNLSINNLDNYLTKKPSSDLINSKSIVNLQNKINHSREKETGKLTTTILENERISCFNVGGEQRLCLPQILTSVLRAFTLHDINNVCDQFRIFCSRCNTEQLNMLKAAQILPPGAPSCGLITKSDAERLCAMLFFYANLFPSQMQAKVRDPYSFYPPDHLEKQIDPEDQQPKLKSVLKESQLILALIKELPSEIRQSVYEDQPLNRIQKIQALKSTLSFKIMHHCFGKCKGLLIPAFYLRYNSRCILCLECESLLSPNKFVLHTHKFNENQICHWGFDSSNWRNLITLTKEDLANPKMEMLKMYLNEFKYHKIVSKI